MKSKSDKIQKYKRCVFPGCRKKAISDGLCIEHVELETKSKQEDLNAKQDSGVDGVLKVTPLEAALFNSMDAEIRNMLQGMHISNLEFQNAEHTFRQTVNQHKIDQDQRLNHRKHLESLLEPKKIAYREFCKNLAEKYKLDPEQMAIDPESRTIRDLRIGKSG